MPADLLRRHGVDLAVDAAVALVVLVVGAWAGSVFSSGLDGPAWFVVLGTAVAAGAARRYPAGALALVWVVTALQLGAASQAIGAQVGVVVVAYRIARHASRPTVWAAGVSVPVGAGLALALALAEPQRFYAATALLSVLRASGATGVVSGFVVVVAVLGTPFVLGLAVRINDQYRRARRERELAETRAVAEHDLAQARAEQTRLTRDVHDIVGHSLAVIIAQADSVRDAAGDGAVRTALTQIAAVGRSSLAEVRDVLARTQDEPAADVARPAELDELVAGVRAAGHEVRETVRGAGSLDDDTAPVAYRAVQEMLTNALKHGAPGGAIDVERHWSVDGLTLRVGNAAADPAAEVREGMGLTGLRQRVEAIGGRLTVEPGDRFVATAFLPRPGRRR